MVVAPKKKPPVKRKRAPAKPKAPVFVPYVPLPGEKAILSDENQIWFHSVFVTLPPEQQQGVIWLMSQMINAPLLNDGYTRFGRFARKYIKDQRPAEVSF